MKSKEGIKECVRLSFLFAKLNFKLRNAGSYLGVLWYLLEPLAFFLIFLLIKRNINVGEIPYYLPYLLMGIILLNFFNSTTNNAMSSIQSNKNIIKSVKVPLESFPLSKLMQFCFSHAFEVFLFIILLTYYNSLTWNILFYPLFFLIYISFIFGLSLILTTISIFVADFRNIWMVLSRIFWLATPIFYSLKENTLLYKINMFNPLYHFINLFRETIIYNKIPDIYYMIFLILFSGLMLYLGLKIFSRYKNKFGEYI